MPFGVAIPSFQRREHLERLLESLRFAIETSQTDGLEVLVGLDGSTDDSEEMIQRLATSYPASLRSIWHPNAGPASTRNRLADEIQSEHVWFLDDDMVVTPQALTTHVEWDRSIAPVLMGPCVIRSDDPSAAMARSWYDERWQRLRTERFLTDPVDITFANCSMPADLLRQHRFLEDFVGYGPEDLELSIRLVAAGVRVAYAADADVEHDFDPTSDERINKLRHEGRNRLLLLSLHPEHRELVFAEDPGRFERLSDRLSRSPVGSSLLWPAARAMSAATTIPLSSKMAVRLQSLAETAALYSGVAKGHRELTTSHRGDPGRP